MVTVSFQELEFSAADFNGIKIEFAEALLINKFMDDFEDYLEFILVGHEENPEMIRKYFQIDWLKHTVTFSPSFFHKDAKNVYCGW